ncbi:sensor histidine kinase [Paenibacillus spongiae]|uniref:sensor histidine kinase n=1 Tax=Paenibacillus spongiae TaxID=2909671 RepID=UPI00283AA2C7|nr:HAMP domain-containing sensor histidine kinase [Paenibacillus spongiae]
MRGWDFDNTSTVSLDGQWQFYPEQFITYPDLSRSENQSSYVQVPGDWSSGLAEGSDSSYGYGTYRLRILVDPLEQPVALWLQGIEASTNVEINGLSEGPIGMPAASAGEYTPRKISFTASYSGKGTEEIEVLIRTANFDNPYNGGILSSLRFGSQAAIDYVRWYSIGFQLASFIILLLHALYAGILYLFNPRERALLLFVLFALTAGFIIVSDYDNLLLVWLSINYTWALKIKLLVYVWQSFLILAIFRRFYTISLKNGWLRLYTAALAAYSGFLLAASAPWVHGSIELGIYAFFYLFPFACLIWTIGTMFFKNQTDENQTDEDMIFLLLSAASILSGVFWHIFNRHQSVIEVYYPIDRIAAIIGFSAYWFKKYFRHTKENAMLNEQLKKADKLKDQFLANTSHELRTPLHGIMNIAQTVATKEKGKMTARSLKDMELLVTISRRMSHMLGDLLDAARLREQRIILQQEPLKIQSIAPGVIGMLNFMTEGKPVRLTMDIAESMPPVMTDEKRLVQILYNLIHNALKYTEEGTVSVSAETRRGRAVIRVSDTGVGMNEETQARAFLPYEQGANGISDGRGIGLGLSICKQLVELHGGALTVRSEPGKGSVFNFDLPLADLSLFRCRSTRFVVRMQRTERKKPSPD